MSFLFPAAGAAIALAGGDKLAGDRGYTSMFQGLGWSRPQMQAAATAELVGGLMMTTRRRRRLGGALVLATSLAVLASELRQGDTQLAAPRGFVLLAGLTALLAPGRRANRGKLARR